MSEPQTPEVDAVVIGAGFGGIYMLHKLRNGLDMKGRDSFRGTMVHTGSWPADLALEGKRVGVIGTGSTGTQFICAASKLARHLTVFQRSAQYSVPSGNGPVSKEYVREIKANY